MRDMFIEHAHQREEKTIVEVLLSRVEHILLNVINFNPVYRSIGFDKINDEVLIILVVARI